MIRSYFSYNNPNSFLNRLRESRFKKFLINFESFEGLPEVRILDIGGTVHYWKTLGELVPENFLITLVNLENKSGQSSDGRFSFIAGDIRDLKFNLNEYDIIFSNSVIEHLGSRAAMKEFSQRITQSRKPYYVQTPSYWFPIEPHCRIPCFQFLPRSIRAWLIFHFTIHYFPKGQTFHDCLRVSDSTIMLSKKELIDLFPSACVYTEKILGIPKSYVAISGKQQ